MTDHERLETIQRLLYLVDAFGLAELEVEEGDLKVCIRGEPVVSASNLAAYPVETPPAPVTPSESETRFHTILSPMTGVFYRSPGPEAPPFVEPGDRVEVGQEIGLIEAMKVFSEIPADRDGRIVEILVASGQLVSQDDPLMLLDPDG